MAVTPDLGLTLDPQATPPAEKIMRLYSAEPQFRATWEEKRQDWSEESPQPAIVYDLTLASMAAKAEWPDQDICNLIIAKRRDLGQPLTPSPKYYDGIIVRARSPIEKAKAAEDLKILLYDLSRETRDEHRKPILDLLHSALGARIHKITKFRGDPPVFWMITDRGSFQIGRVDNITSKTKFANVFAYATGVVLDQYSNSQWHIYAQGLLWAAVEDDVGNPSYPKLETLEWLHNYLSAHTPQPEINKNVVSGKVPFMEKGSHVHIFMPHFTRWVKKWSPGARVDPFYMGIRLKLIGGQQHTTHVTLGEWRTTRSTWRLPEEFDDWLDRLSI